MRKEEVQHSLATVTEQGIRLHYATHTRVRLNDSVLGFRGNDVPRQIEM